MRTHARMDPSHLALKPKTSEIGIAPCPCPIPVTPQNHYISVLGQYGLVFNLREWSHPSSVFGWRNITRGCIVIYDLLEWDMHAILSHLILLPHSCHSAIALALASASHFVVCLGPGPHCLVCHRPRQPCCFFIVTPRRSPSCRCRVAGLNNKMRKEEEKSCGQWRRTVPVRDEFILEYLKDTCTRHLKGIFSPGVWSPNQTLG